MTVVATSRNVRTRIIGLLSVPVFVGLPLLALPVTTAPVAHAQSTCSFQWGVKQAFRSYIQGPIAKGNWNSSTDVGFVGDARGASSAFTFTPQKATIHNTTDATIPLNGKLHFKGHNYGGPDLLDMQISDLKLDVKGSTATLIVDYLSYTSDMVDKTKRGEPIQGDDVALITIDLNYPAATDTGIIDLSGTTTLTEEGHKLFLAYDAGAAMDPTAGVVKLDGSCAGGSSSSTNTLNRATTSNNKCVEFSRLKGEFTGANKEIFGMVSELNDAFGGLNTLMCNVQTFQNNLDSFTGTNTTTTTQAASGTGGATTGTQTGTAAGTQTGTAAGTGTTASESSVTQAGSGVTVSSGSAGASTSGASTSDASANGAASGGGSAAVCSATSAHGISNAKAAWGVKKSFQSYITGSIAKGSWSLSGVNHSGGQFHFNGQSGAVDAATKSGTIAFGGGIKFSGHHGILNLQITNLEIQFAGNSGSLVANVISSDTSGKVTNFGRVALANLSFNSLNVSDSQASGAASVALTDAGAKAFAGFYEPGTALDPLQFSANLSAKANCAGGQGSAAAQTAAGGNSNGPSAAELLAQGNGAAAAEGGADAVKFDDASTSTVGYEDGSKKFKINKSAQTAKGFGEGGVMRPELYILLTVLAFVIAGGSMGRLAISHPA
ncbi:HtaA domain-containing protein [Corynebacterium sp. HS2168-gen11]|uniref:HtaA domain-containing protein n=1 Tax=Corynebacterium sp. HS2168-gen11 TaxID=2974027 RepID=UPI00216B1AAA|nr:HtaA domain-containing protein [Corynebacterium sp. HS2168-gen11]MCS4535894.1 HtaA domain-containing protein [Corynebacterium sp. HS2168-gen11]